MAVNLDPPKVLLPVPGVLVGSAIAGIKQNERNDLAIFKFSDATCVAGVYTQSHFAAAPVGLAQARQSNAQAWLINSGNANAATGETGIADATHTCSHAARLLQIADVEVQPFSTGVIGERLPVERMESGIDAAFRELNEDGWLDAAGAIMTTDTVPKGCSKQIVIDGITVTITGIAKGSGMIKPNMATMLAYIACDANVSSEMVNALVKDISTRSFNRITVDGDTSTNDCFMLACTREADHEVISSADSAGYDQLGEALYEVALWLAQSIVRDGEGATKFITVRVRGGHTLADALAVAYTVAESPLVKTAMFAGDANWGRFCMAIGRSPISGIQPEKVALWLDDVLVAEKGMISADYSEEAGAKVLAQSEFKIEIDLGLGEAEETVWTTDLSYEYVRINAEYRT